MLQMKKSRHSAWHIKHAQNATDQWLNGWLKYRLPKFTQLIRRRVLPNLNMTELNWVFWAWSANFSNEFASLYLSWISQSSELNIQRENIIGKKKLYSIITSKQKITWKYTGKNAWAITYWEGSCNQGCWEKDLQSK